jgi:hypothetical protein
LLDSRLDRFDLAQDALTLTPFLFLRKTGFNFGDLGRQGRGFGCKRISSSARAIEIAAEIVH